MMSAPPPPPPVPVAGNMPPPLPVGATAPPLAGAGDGQDVAAPEELDPIEAKKEELLADPAFAKFVKLYKMKVPLLNIRLQMRAGGVFDPDDILIFASKGDINQLKKIGEYTGD